MDDTHPGEVLIGEELERILAQAQYQPQTGDRALAFTRVDAGHVAAVIAVPVSTSLTGGRPYLSIWLDASGGPWSDTDVDTDGYDAPVLSGHTHATLDEAMLSHNDQVTSWLITRTRSLHLDWFVPEDPRGYDNSPPFLEPDFLTLRRAGGDFYVAARFDGTATLTKINGGDGAEAYLTGIAALVQTGRIGLESMKTGDDVESTLKRATLEHFLAEAEARISRCRLGDTIRQAFGQDGICRHETFSAAALAEHLGVSADELRDIRSGQLWSAGAELMEAMDAFAREHARS